MRRLLLRHEAQLSSVEDIPGLGIYSGTSLKQPAYSRGPFNRIVGGLTECGLRTVRIAHYTTQHLKCLSSVDGIPFRSHTASRH